MEKIRKIIINSNEVTQMFSDIKSSNKLTYATEPERDNDMRLNNTELNYAYIPSVELTFRYLSLEEYSKIIQILNTPSFIVSYFDIELGKNVTRKMYMSENSREKLYNKGGRLKALLGLKITLVSYKGYKTYMELEE